MRISDWSSDVWLFRSLRQAQWRASTGSARTDYLGRTWLRSQLLVGILEHFVGRLDHLRVDLIGALGFDHVDQFLDHVDVRGFEIARAHDAAPVQTRDADLRCAAGGTLDRKSTRLNSSH